MTSIPVQQEWSDDKTLDAILAHAASYRLPADPLAWCPLAPDSASAFLRGVILETVVQYLSDGRTRSTEIGREIGIRFAVTDADSARLYAHMV